MPRFRRLLASDVEEKTPGELVTVADRHAERLLTDALTALLPGSRVVGEEGCAANPRLMDDLDKGLVWIVDPLDGTAHFASGKEPFGIMVGLARDGVAIAGWIFAPISRAMHFAFLGEGAFVTSGGGETKRLVSAKGPARPIATVASLYMEPAFAAGVIEAAASDFDLQPVPRCAAVHYPRLCRGDYQVAMFQRTLPWDHAAGALLLEEAGGCVRRWDGTRFHFHDRRLGILAASSSELWRIAAGRMLAPERIQRATA